MVEAKFQYLDILILSQLQHTLNPDCKNMIPGEVPGLGKLVLQARLVSLSVGFFDGEARW